MGCMDFIIEKIKRIFNFGYSYYMTPRMVEPMLANSRFQGAPINYY